MPPPLWRHQRQLVALCGRPQRLGGGGSRRVRPQFSATAPRDRHRQFDLILLPDIYGSAEAVVENDEQFIRQIKPGGKLIHRHGLPLETVADELRATGRQVFTFGIEAGDYEAFDVRVEDGQMAFGLRSSIFNFSDLRMNYPGLHNVLNATAGYCGHPSAGGFTPELPAALAGFRA